MMLSPEAREIVKQAAMEAFTRHLTPDEVFTEVVRLCRDARTTEEVEAAGKMVGQITAFGRMLRGMDEEAPSVVAPPDPPDAPEAPAAAAAVPEVEEMHTVAVGEAA